MKVVNLAQVQIYSKSKDSNLNIYVKVEPEPMDRLRFGIFRYIDSYDVVGSLYDPLKGLFHVEHIAKGHFYLGMDTYNRIAMKKGGIAGILMKMYTMDTSINKQVISSRSQVHLRLGLFTEINDINRWIIEEVLYRLRYEPV
jgi:hypothetical protein